MKNLPLNSLRAFAVVFEAGGVREASKRLLVAHSSISRHIRELEAWVGIPLVQGYKTRRQILFTPQGEALGKAAWQNLVELERVVGSLREVYSPNSVVISTTASVAVRWLLPLLPDLQSEFPNIEISVVTEQTIKDPAEGGADFSIRMGKGPWQEVEARPLMDDFLFPVVHPKLLKEISGRDPAQIFKKYPLLHDRDPMASWSLWFETFPIKGLNWQKGPRFSSSDIVLRAAARGTGIALARGQLATEDIQTGALVRPFGKKEIVLRDGYWLIKSNKGYLKKSARSVFSWLLKKGKEPPPKL